MEKQQTIKEKEQLIAELVKEQVSMINQMELAEGEQFELLNKKVVEIDQQVTTLNWRLRWDKHAKKILETQPHDMPETEEITNPESPVAAEAL